MLSEETKQRIILEEKYRNEVQNQLQTKESSKLNLWKLLNSSFGIFFLSTVIIGIITFSYDSIQENKIQKEQTRLKDITKKQLQTELKHRLRTLITISDTLKLYESRDIYLAYYGKSACKDLDQKYYNFQSFYEEYSVFSIFRLLDELLKYDKGNKYSDLKDRLESIKPFVVKLGENWFYQITFFDDSKINLHKNIGLSYDSINKIKYFRTKEADIAIFKLKKYLKLFYIGNHQEIKEIEKTINLFFSNEKK